MQHSKLAVAVDRGLYGDKGGGTPRQAVESPDSLKSTATARIIDLVSEGEIEGFFHGNASDQFLQDVYYNETPIQNADGTKNFKSVQVEARLGTQTQDHIPGFPSVENEIGIGVALTAATPWTRSFTNLTLSAVRVRLQVNGLSKTNQTNGDITGHTVAYAIDLAVDGGAFTQVMNSAFTGKASAPYERSHRIELPPATTSGWIIRVRRLTADDATVYIQDDTAVSSVTEIVDGKFSYPLSAVIGSQLDASQFQSIPTRSFHLKGRRIKVPVNYDPATGVYTGVWNGTFKIAYSNNPAWVFYDLATNPRYGLGHLVQELQIDKWSLYAIGQYCDQIVPNGFGGTERRMTCNLYLQKQGDAFKVLTDLASVFRGICYWAGGSIVAVADRPTDPVYTYTNANVVNGTFKYESSARKARHTAVLVSWNDMTDFGRLKVDYYDNPTSMARYGFNQTDIHAMGCTSRGQAQRLAKWILYSEELLTNTCTWSVGIDGTYAVPGQIVRVADKHRAGRRNGGRISSATTTVITLDKWPAVNPAIGDSFTVILPTGVSQTRLIGAFNAGLRTVTVGLAFSAAPLAQSVWSIDSNDVNTQLFRVLQVLEDETTSGMYHLVGLQHNPSIFDAVDLGEPISIEPISVVSPSNQPRPTTVTITSVERAGAVSSGILVTASWTNTLGASSYVVQWKKDAGEWSTAQPVNGTTSDYDTPVPGVYTAKVSAVNALGIISPPTLSAPFTVVDQTKKPTSITAIEGAMYGSGNLLEGSTFETVASSGWTLAVDADGLSSSWIVINPAGATWHPLGMNALGHSRPGTPTGEYTIWSPAIPVTPGIRYCASAWTAVHRSTGQLELQFIDAAGTPLLVASDTNVGLGNGGTSLVGFQRPRVFLVAPPGTVTARIVLRTYGATGPVPYLWMVRPMLEEVSALAVNPSPWVPSAASMESKILASFAAAAAAQDTADGAIVTYQQGTAPAHPPASLGDFWIDTANGNKINRSNGSSWILAQDTGIPQAIIDAAAAQLTANGKVKTWFALSTAPPTASAIGDLWYVTDQATLKRWNGSAWVLIADNAAETLNDYVANAKFEQGMAYWTLQTGWREAVNTGGAFQGVRALCADGAISPLVDSRAYSDKQFSVAPGDVYVVSAMVKQLSPNGTLAMGLYLLNAAGGYSSVVESPQTAANLGLSFNVYKKIAFRCVVPAGNAVKAFMSFARFGHNVGCWVIDNVTVTKMPSNLDDVMDSPTYGKVRGVTLSNGTMVGITDGGNLIPNPAFSKVVSVSPTIFNTALTTGQAMADDWYFQGADGRSYLYYERSGYSSVLFRVDPAMVLAGSAAYNAIQLISMSSIAVEYSRRYVMYIKWTHGRNAVPPVGFDGLFRYSVQWLDASDNDLGSSSYTDISILTPTALSEYYFTVTPPAGAKKAKIYLQNYTRNSGGSTLTPSGALWSDLRVISVGMYQAQNMDMDIENGTVYGKPANADLYDSGGVRRVGLRIGGSGQRVGNQRNLNQVVAQQTATATKLSATSAGAISVNAHTLNYGSFSVAYSAVASAVTGLTQNVTYVVYCIDDAFAGGTRTYYVAANPAAAAALGDGIVIVGQIKIPTSGGSTGGGGGGGGDPNDWCVLADSFMPDGSLAQDNHRGMMIPTYNQNPEDPGVIHRPIERNVIAMQECVVIQTESGAWLGLSTSTPMTLRTGRCVNVMDMMYHDALVYRVGGGYTWEAVVGIHDIGTHPVCLLSVHNQCFPAGGSMDAFIFSHNIINGKP